MESLFNTETSKEIYNRINKLTPESQRRWGTMDVAQMFTHCSITLEVAVGKRNPKRLLMGVILRPFFKSIFFNDKPYSQNTPTDNSFIVSDKRDFEIEKVRLLELIKQFSEGGPDSCTKHPHSFFGKLSPDEWAKGMYKHLDHHLKQFGV